MKLIRFETRKIGDKKWKGIFCTYWNVCDNYSEYSNLAERLKGPKNYVNEVPEEWRFYFTENGLKEHDDLIQLMVKAHKKYNYEVRTIEVKNTDKLKKRKCRILDQHQAVIWKETK